MTGLVKLRVHHMGVAHWSWATDLVDLDSDQRAALLIVSRADRFGGYVHCVQGAEARGLIFSVTHLVSVPPPTPDASVIKRDHEGWASEVVELYRRGPAHELWPQPEAAIDRLAEEILAGATPGLYPASWRSKGGDT